MATLNTMRTRWGWAVTGFIFLALVMFIVSDLFTRNGGFMGNTDVGRISGETISFEEFSEKQSEMEFIYQAIYNTSSIPAQMTQQINDQVWNGFILDYAFLPSFKKDGISVGSEEALDMVNGMYLSPVYTQFFPNEEAMKEFLLQIRSNDRAFAVWNYLKRQANIDRMMTKYGALIKAGFMASDLAVERAVQTASTSYDARAFMVPYSTIADSTVVVSKSAIRKYYDAHKSQYKQTTSRDVEYVVFDLSPSEADFEAAKSDVQALADEFRSAANPIQYVSISAKLRFAADTMYMRATDVPADLTAVATGAFQEPILVGTTYTMARLAGSKVQADTVGFDAVTPEGVVDAGRMAIDMLADDLKAQVLKANVGDVVTFTDNYGEPAELVITYKNAPVKMVQIAKVEYTVYPSSETQTRVYNEMSAFAAKAGKTAESFREAVDELGLSKRTVRIRPEERNINGLTEPRPLLNWAYGPKAKKGTVSDMLQIDGNYVIALLADVQKEGYIALEQVEAQIRSELVKEEKARMIAAKISGTTLEQMAASVSVEVQNVEGVSLQMPFMAQFGYEPKLAGAISALAAGTISKPVAGSQGVFVVEPVAQNVTDESITPDMQRAKLNSNAIYNIEQRLMQAIYELAKVRDMRVRYF